MMDLPANGALHSSTVLSKPPLVLDLSIFKQSSYRVLYLWLLEQPGCIDATFTHVQGSHIAAAHRAGHKCDVSCAYAAQITLLLRGRGDIYDRRDH